MKKFTVLSLIGFLILMFGAVSYAMEYKASGWLDFSSEYGKNFMGTPPYETTGNLYGPRPSSAAPATGANHIPGAGPGGSDVTFDKTRAYLEGRARFRFDAVADKNLMGTLYFEVDSVRWGEKGVGRNSIGGFGGDAPGVEVKNVYITFGMPWIPVPITMKVGLQPMAYRPDILVYNDGMGITAGIKVDPVNVKLTYFKGIENEDWSSDDADIYGLELNTKVQTLTIGAYALHYNMNTFPFSAPTAPTSTQTNRAAMTWLGFYTDGKLGPLNINFDFAYDTGTVKGRGIYAYQPDIDYSGWGIIAKAKYPWEKFTFGVVGIYGSGSDANKTNKSGRQDGSTTASGTIPKDVDGYVVTPGCETGGDVSLIFYGVGPGGFNRALTSYGASGIYGNLYPGTIGGTWALGGNVAMKVMPEYEVELRGLYIGDTTKNGNTVGNALENPLFPALGIRDDKSIGVEVNLLNTFQIYKNLQFRLGFAYLFAGDGMDLVNANTGLNESPENPYLIVSRLFYVF